MANRETEIHTIRFLSTVDNRMWTFARIRSNNKTVTAHGYTIYSNAIENYWQYF